MGAPKRASERSWGFLGTFKDFCRHTTMNTNICTYCNEPGDHRDHVVPSSYFEIKKSFNPNHWVKACQECNSTLTSSMYVTIPDRAGYLLKKYKNKYNKLLKIPSWTKEELSEIGPVLRKHIVASMEQKERIISRLEFLHKVSIS